MTLTLNPPPTPVEPVTEILHGVEVVDPYRWLEDQNSERTRNWLEQQTAYTRAYLSSLPMCESIRQRANDLLSMPFVLEIGNVDDRFFFLKRYADREQPVIVMRNGLFGEDKVLIDPVTRSNATTTSVSITKISHDGRFLAYSVRQNGADHSTLEILDIERNMNLPDRLPNSSHIGIAFALDGSGFYYCHRRLHDLRPNYRAVYFHRFGAPECEDHEVFFAGEEANLFLGILDSPEPNLLAYPVFSVGKDRRNSLFLHRLASTSGPKLLIRNIAGCFAPFFVRGTLLAFTNLGAPNFRVVRIDVDDPEPAHWRDVVPESDRRIQEFAVAGDQVFVTRVHRFSTSIEAFDVWGNQAEDIHFARHGTVSLLNRTAASDKLFYSCMSVSEPPTVYCYDTGKRREFCWDRTTIPFDPSIIRIEEVTYTSRDGTSVPLFLAGRKELLNCSNLPTFLTGYGGFGIPVTPRFTAFATFLIEQGVLFAVPALRGGSEMGEGWHLAGIREKRQNSFDDFIAAAEWLVSQRRSAAGRIAIGGGSNAGLLVGAAITQRPDLFRVAICLGPLLDMLRYHLYDFAAGWTDEYGSSDDEREFRYLLAYSPYHRVKDGVQYPATLFISGDADTRCNPMHARKMAARLQWATSCRYPILLDYKPKWGHTPVQPLSTKIEALTNRLAFLCHELAIDVQPWRPC